MARQLTEQNSPLEDNIKSSSKTVAIEEHSLNSNCDNEKQTEMEESAPVVEDPNSSLDSKCDDEKQSEKQAEK